MRLFCTSLLVLFIGMSYSCKVNRIINKKECNELIQSIHEIWSGEDGFYVSEDAIYNKLSEIEGSSLCRSKFTEEIGLNILGEPYATIEEAPNLFRLSVHYTDKSKYIAYEYRFIEKNSKYLHKFIVVFNVSRNEFIGFLKFSPKREY